MLRIIDGRRRLARMLRRPAVLVATFASLLTGASTAAASDWLDVLKPPDHDAVTVGIADLFALPDFDAYGDLVVTGDVGVHEVPDANAATAETGLDAPEAAFLPRGVTGEPTYSVSGKVSATFTFSTERAHVADDSSVSALPRPPGVDGAQVRLEAGPGIAAVWSQSTGLPRLIVARAVAPTVVSSGASLETIRNYLPSLPGLSDSRVTTSTSEVNGVPATILATDDQIFAAVVWVTDGTVTLVAGTLDTSEILAVARTLR
ncbi:MAG TPA: hypothetical protein VIT64_01635 [Ilumatobacteraceae bacterium]